MDSVYEETRIAVWKSAEQIEKKLKEMLKK